MATHIPYANGSYNFVLAVLVLSVQNVMTRLQEPPWLQAGLMKVFSGQDSNFLPKSQDRVNKSLVAVDLDEVGRGEAKKGLSHLSGLSGPRDSTK